MYVCTYLQRMFILKIEATTRGYTYIVHIIVYIYCIRGSGEVKLSELGKSLKRLGFIFYII